MSDLVLTHLADRVLTLSLNRPEKRNALSLELIEALGAAVEHARAQAEAGAVRVVILAGAGPVFCAGMDLEGVMSDVPAMTGMLETLARTLLRIRGLACPTMARVQGAAVGGGCGLMVVADFAFTHPEARIGYPEVTLGLTPAVVAPWLMRKVGAGKARSLLLSGGTMSGRDAHAAGIADFLSAAEQLDPTAAAFAAKLISGGPRAQATTKRWLNELDGSLEETIALRAAALSAEVIASPEAQESLRRLFGKQAG